MQPERACRVYPPVVPEHHGFTPGLASTVTREDDRAIVSVSGEMDLATAPGFEREVLALLALPIGAVTVDLGGLTFLDSSGIHALLTIRKSACEHRVEMTVASVPQQARRVLEITGVAEMFRVDASDA